MDTEEQSNLETYFPDMETLQFMSTIPPSLAPDVDTMILDAVSLLESLALEAIINSHDSKTENPSLKAHGTPFEQLVIEMTGLFH